MPNTEYDSETNTQPSSPPPLAEPPPQAQQTPPRAAAAAPATVQIHNERRGNLIYLRLEDQFSDVITYKIKKTTELRKAFNDYAARKGIHVHALRFFHNGERVDGFHTPEYLHMEEEDEIDVMLESTGSLPWETRSLPDLNSAAPAGPVIPPPPQAAAVATAAPAAARGDVRSKSITVRVVDMEGRVTYFKIKTTMKMRRLFDTYAARGNVDVRVLRFLLDGQHIPPDLTPVELELEEEDQIDIRLQQWG